MRGGENIEAVGEFMTLREAYNSGYITKDDIMEMSYYSLGAVYKIPEGLTGTDAFNSDNWEKIDYIPRTQELVPLDEQTERDIKNSYFALNSNEFEAEGKNYDPDILYLTYYGQSNGYYIVKIKSDILNYPGAGFIDDYDGIVFYEFYPTRQVFYY